MNIKPLFNRILARKVKKQQKSACGIEILQDEEQIEKAVVLQIGSSAQNCGINIGDTIFFEPHVTAEISIGANDLILICIEDILALECIGDYNPTISSKAVNSNSIQTYNILANQQFMNIQDHMVGNKNKETI